MNTTQPSRSRTSTLRILPRHLGTASDDLDLALHFNPETRTYHRTQKGSK